MSKPERMNTLVYMMPYFIPFPQTLNYQSLLAVSYSEETFLLFGIADN